MQYHVMIVEDDFALRQLYSLYLERGKFKHTAVASAQKALDAMETMSIDVLLVDVNLGEEVDGLDLIKAVRDNKDYDDVKIVTLTSFPERYDINDPARIDLSLNKPVDYAKLMNSLHSLLGDRTA